eukprot:11206292-Lingulodinium_polyedra.AAC.1
MVRPAGPGGKSRRDPGAGPTWPAGDTHARTHCMPSHGPRGRRASCTHEPVRGAGQASVQWQRARCTRGSSA